MEGKFDGRKRLAGGATVKPGGQLQSKVKEEREVRERRKLVSK